MYILFLTATNRQASNYFLYHSLILICHFIDINVVHLLVRVTNGNVSSPLFVIGDRQQSDSSEHVTKLLSVDGIAITLRTESSYVNRIGLSTIVFSSYLTSVL